MNLPFARLFWSGAILSALLLTGCATNRIDWNTRVGNYTFDQAVTEIGPPDKQAKITDGTLVAEWLTRRGYSQTYASGVYGPYGYPGYYGPNYVSSYSPDYFLRLTFAPDGKLQSWKKFSR